MLRVKSLSARPPPVRINPANGLLNRNLVQQRITCLAATRLQSNGPPSKAPVAVEKPPLMVRIKREINHYRQGTKLLGLEMKISFRLLLRMSAGYELSRREMIQLKRTTGDISRLVPFAAFIIIPFMELLLPIALKVFPNLLPSTYESHGDKQTKLERLRSTRNLVSQTIKDNKSHFKPANISDHEKSVFNHFYEHVRIHGEPESREQLLEVARLFTDDTVLDNVTRPYLVALAKYLNLQPFGTDVMLRYRIRYNMLQLKKDDFTIYYEGVDRLTPAELFTACASRGIRTSQVSPEVLRQNLKVWLDMRRDKIPSTLLLMATAFNYGDISSQKSLYDALCDVLSGIPDELYHEVKVHVVQEPGISPEQRLVQLREQEEMLKEERQQEKNEVVKVRDNLSLDDWEKKQRTH